MGRAERVLIVGGGIAGLTLAAALHVDGVEVELVEADAEWNTSGAGISVQRTVPAAGHRPFVRSLRHHGSVEQSSNQMQRRLQGGATDGGRPRGRGNWCAHRR